MIFGFIVLGFHVLKSYYEYANPLFLDRLTTILI